jgi:hypothetical protein
MIKPRSIGTGLSVFALVLAGTVARAQDSAHEDLTPCPGSAPEPMQSAAWSVAFCNRTGHDVVIEFHDNDCPAQDWARRGDVYQRMLRRGESKTLPLCYANEAQAKKPAPGTPTLRIPGGKGVVTTWSVVGDCGDHSKALNLDARTFYDRGEYKTGIILLQYPTGASHCMAESAGTPGVAADSAQSSTREAPPQSQHLQTQPPVAPHSPIAAPGAIAANAPGTASNRSSRQPSLSAAVDAKDIVARTVQVFAKGGLGYRCNFTLALTFTDGGSWNDRTMVDITGGEDDVPIATRKYLKSVSKVALTSSKCAQK